MKNLDLNDSKVVILVEGLTEQILLPFLAQAYGLDLKAMGATIMPAGGAKKLAQLYMRLKEKIEQPIFCLFDQDAQTWATEVNSNLRAKDQVYIITEGEIEDLMQLDFLVNQLNKYLTADYLNDNNFLVSISDFSLPYKRTAILDQIWRQRQLGKFEKVKFARFIINDLCNDNDIVAGGKVMIDKLMTSFDLAAGL